MTTLLLAAIIGIGAAAGATPAVQDQQVRVGISVAGHEVMWFVPRQEKYTQDTKGGPGVCSVVDEADAKTKDGVPIKGFHFIGWKEGAGYRVLAFAIVPTNAAAGSQGVCSGGSGFKEVDFGSVHVLPGQDVPFAKMKDIGVEPWVIRVGPKRK